MRPGRLDGPLADVVVLDLGQAAVAPVAASYLGMLGATVVKVEPPRGDMVRAGEPTMRGTSTTFIGNNWTKLGVCLDLKSDHGRDRLAHLVARSDLLIENFRSPQVLERLGFDFETRMSQLNPRLVYVESSAFGDGGPYADMVSNEWITEAVGGLVSATGDRGRPEFMRGSSLLDWSGAMVNTVVCLAALLHRETTGRGLAVRTSQLGSTLFAGVTRVAELLDTGVPPKPQGSLGRSFAPDGAFATADGFLGLSAPSSSTWSALCGVLGLEHLLCDPRFVDNAARVRNRDDLGAALEERLRTRPATVWLSELEGADVPHTCFPYDRRLSDELSAHPQVVAKRHLVAMPTPWGLARTAGPQWMFSRTPATIARPSPELGEHDDAVTDLLPTPAQPVEGDGNRHFVRDDPAGLRPLEGVRVLQVATGVSGSLAGRVLWELGADVRRIEPPGGDWLREAAPEGHASDALHRAGNADTQPYRLDLRSIEGRARLASLLDGVDVLLLGLETRQLGALGLEDAATLADETRVVCQVTGWGADGPYAGRPATELDVQAAVGMYRHVGAADEPPVRVGFDLVSVNTALAAAQGVLAALWERRRSGRGQKVEVSMLATAVALSQWGITAESRVDRERGLQLEGYDLPPDPGVRCGDGRCCRLDFRKDHDNWRRLFERLGLDDLAEDPRFQDEETLTLHRQQLGDVLSDAMCGWSFDELESYVRALGGTVVPVLRLDEVLDHAQVRGLGVVRPGEPVAVGLPYRASYWTADAPRDHERT